MHVLQNQSVGESEDNSAFVEEECDREADPVRDLSAVGDDEEGRPLE